ncbi:endonuclease/exonuclease/phosphatase family protein [Caulobacter sp.]|uniref:endonuclease/exonuclease/phosphatase family protein n=1 Tax=Caulobacter sp. TaxID=78 RepID=UPI0031CF6D0E
MHRPLAALALCLSLAACASVPPSPSPSPRAPLRVATWNMEHLSEDGAQGCKARTDADYAVMRRYAEQLNADVIAFEEVESVKAAARVFDPAKYQLIIEERPAGEHFACGGQEGRKLTRQAVGFAIRKGVSFERAPDLVDLALGNPNLRSGVDITVRAPGHAPLRLLAVHLKSGCFSGLGGQACPTLQQQVPVLERWIDARAAEPVRFVVLGDFNRRLARKDDVLWADLDDGQPANADLSLAEGTTTPKCDPRYSEFIDHIVLDARAGRDLVGFEEQAYAPADGHPSDHCPVVAVLR